MVRPIRESRSVAGSGPPSVEKVRRPSRPEGKRNLAAIIAAGRPAPASPPAISKRHRLLPQPGGFEGFGAVGEVLLPDHQASPQSTKLKQRLVYGNAAGRSMSLVMGRDEKLVAQVEDLHGLRAKVIERVHHLSPDLLVAVMTMGDGVPIRGQQVLRGAVFDARIYAQDQQVEVTTIGGCACPTHELAQQQPAKPGPQRQSHPGAG